MTDIKNLTDAELVEAVRQRIFLMFPLSLEYETDAREVWPKRFGALCSELSHAMKDGRDGCLGSLPDGGKEEGMKVNVRISASQTMIYSETVEMEEAEFHKIEAMLDEDETVASELLEEYLQTDDPYDWEPMEVDTFEIVK